MRKGKEAIKEVSSRLVGNISCLLPQSTACMCLRLYNLLYYLRRIHFLVAASAKCFKL